MDFPTCPTCSLTMTRLIGGIFWCDRCGTLRLGQQVSAPKLVEFCRRYQEQAPVEFGQWTTLGIKDSIWPEEPRELTPAEKELAALRLAHAEAVKLLDECADPRTSSAQSIAALRDLLCPNLPPENGLGNVR